MAVLAKPQAESPAAKQLLALDKSTRCFHKNSMSLHPKIPSAKIAKRMSALTRALSWISFPPVDSIEKKSEPSLAHCSYNSSIVSQYFPLRITGGRLNSRKSLGVVRIAVFKPYFSDASFIPFKRIRLTSIPYLGCSVKSGRVSNSIKTPGA